MSDIDRTDNRGSTCRNCRNYSATTCRQIALNVARDITVASRSLGDDAGEYALRTADRFAKWLETGQIPVRQPAA